MEITGGALSDGFLAKCSWAQMIAIFEAATKVAGIPVATFRCNDLHRQVGSGKPFRSHEQAFLFGIFPYAESGAALKEAGSVGRRNIELQLLTRILQVPLANPGVTINMVHQAADSEIYCGPHLAGFRNQALQNVAKRTLVVHYWWFVCHSPSYHLTRSHSYCKGRP